MAGEHSGGDRLLLLATSSIADWQQVRLAGCGCWENGQGKGCMLTFALACEAVTPAVWHKDANRLQSPVTMQPMHQLLLLWRAVDSAVALLSASSH